MAYKEQEVKALKKFIEDHRQQLYSMGTIKLDAGQTIADVNGFLTTQYSILESSQSYTLADPCYHRLLKIRQLLEAHLGIGS